ncbi:MAG: cytochrome c oxidase accessory protein CcoG [Flammeovirgaceae bacterium]
MDFRDQVGVLDEEGKMEKMYPKKVKGKLNTLRNYFAYFLLTILLITPFIKINNRPFMLFNVLERKFILFGQPFHPQDFYLFALGMLTFMVFVVLFTVVFGRVFCGWACPQTIFLEFVFRKIEYWIEGDASQQKALDKSSWTTEKLLKKGLKHTIFFILSFFIANIFLSYFVGTERLWQLIEDTPLKHIGSFTALLIFTGVFYFVFAKFRELACIVVCPYGRLQGVLLDEKSVVVAYDTVRGEPRGKIKKGEERKLGDCIDCKLCVQVCPTGIDIRNGTQLECINCTACIDACDEVMLKIDKPKGLIRYDSLNGIKNKTPLKFTSRMAAYSIVLAILLGVLSFLLVSRQDVQVTILRVPGSLSQELDSLTVGNLYNIEMVNKTFEEINLEIALANSEGKIKIIGQESNILKLKEGEVMKSTFFIEMPKSKIKKANQKLKVLIKSNNELIDEVETSFLGTYKK